MLLAGLLPVCRPAAAMWLHRTVCHPRTVLELPRPVCHPQMVQEVQQTVCQAAMLLRVRVRMVRLWSLQLIQLLAVLHHHPSRLATVCW